MAEAVFQPGPMSARGITPGDSFNTGVEQNQSMMQRASNLRQSKQMEEMRAQQIEEARILMPVIQAKAKADIISAGASIANNTRLETFRGQASAASVAANDEFLAATQLADWDAQSAELARIQAKYSWMGNLPEYSGFLGIVDKARANAVTRAMTEMTLDASLERATIAAETRFATTEVTTGSREKVAETAASARVAGAEIAAGSREEIAAANRDTRVDVAKFKAAQQSAIQADKDAAKASAAGDEGNSAIYRKHAAEFREAAKREMAEPSKAQDFTIPNVTDKPRLYTSPEQPGAAPSFAPAVKTPADVIEAMQQMVDDGVIDAEQARETLKKLGFKSKGG